MDSTKVMRPTRRLERAAAPVVSQSPRGVRLRAGARVGRLSKVGVGFGLTGGVRREGVAQVAETEDPPHLCIQVGHLGHLELVGGHHTCEWGVGLGLGSLGEEDADECLTRARSRPCYVIRQI